MLTVRLLGSFSAEINNQPLHFRSDKTQALFIYLLLADTAPTRRDLLATLLWPNNRDDRARKNLRDAIFHLRKAFDQHVPHIANHYFNSTRKDVQFLHHDKILLDTVQLDATNAAELVRGELCSGFHLTEAEPFMEWLLLTREQWYRHSLMLLAEQTEQLLTDKQLQQALMVAQHQLSMQPWREVAHQQAMRALALSENWAGLEKQFAACHAVLMNELAVEPSETTRTLYQSLRPKQEAAHNLPIEPSPFIGRRTELERINAAINKRRYRLFTLSGIGGSGKTRLAIEVAHQQLAHFSDGVWFVSLASSDQISDIFPAIAEAIQLQLTSDSPIEKQLYSYLADKSLLLLLDNLEQLPAETAVLISTLLNQTKNLIILTTSRSRLNLRAEKLFLVDGLAFPEAQTTDNLTSYESVALFLEQAARVRGNPLPTPTYSTIGEICRLLTGSPLAIELAAALTELFLVDEIAERLGNSMATLATTMEDIPARQRSIRAVFDYSWRLLTANQQQGLAQLSLFRRPFSLDAAQAVAAISHTDLLALIKSSWLRLEENGRYRFHELLREFGQAQLAQNADWLNLTNGRYISYHLNLLWEHTSMFERDLSGQVFNTLRQNRADFANAWRMGMKTDAYGELYKSAATLREIYLHGGLLAQGKELFDTAIAKLQPMIATSTTPTDAQKLLVSVLLHQVSFREETTVDAAMLQTIQDALDLVQRLDDFELIIDVRIAQARVMWRLGQFDAAFNLVEQLVPLAKAHGSPLQYANVRLRMAIISHVRNHFALSEQIYREILESVDSTIYPVFVARINHNLANLLEDIGCFAETQHIHETNLQVWEQTGHQHQKAITLEGLGNVLRLQGCYDLAQPPLQSCLQHYETVNDLDGIANTHYKLGHITLAMGELDLAEQHFQIMLETRQRMQHYDPYIVWIELAQVALRRGQLDKAVRLVQRSLPTILEDNANVEVSFDTYSGCYRVLAQTADPAAEKVLKRAITALLAQADLFTDSAAKQTFLTQVDAHRELLAAADVRVNV